MNLNKLILFFLINFINLILIHLYLSLVDCAHIHLDQYSHHKRQQHQQQQHRHHFKQETINKRNTNHDKIINNINRRQHIQPVFIPNEIPVIAAAAAQPLQVHRQSQHLFPTIFSGPLALAAFLFTLPLIPSLIMAPMAMAGLPSAFNVFNTMVSGLTNGKPIQSLIDPLYSANSINNSSNILQQPIRRQFNVMKNIAKTVRLVMNRRYSNKLNAHEHTHDDPLPPELNDIQNNENLHLNYPDKIENIESIDPMHELETKIINQHFNATNSSSLISSASSTTASNNMIDNNIDDSMMINNKIDQMGKSIKGMDLLYTSLKDIYSIIRNGLRRYELTDSDCQSRIVCEIHQKIISHNKLLKTFSANALDLLNLEKHIDSVNSLNAKSKESIKFYINAAKIGFADKDCNREFRNCPTITNSPSRQFRRFLLNHKSSLFNHI